MSRILAEISTKLYKKLRETIWITDFLQLFLPDVVAPAVISIFIILDSGIKIVPIYYGEISDCSQRDHFHVAILYLPISLSEIKLVYSNDKNPERLMSLRGYLEVVVELRVT